MIQASGVIICLGYILGLLFTAVPWGGAWVMLLGIVGAIIFRKRRLNPSKARQKTPNTQLKANTPPFVLFSPHARVWLIAGALGLLATFYFQLRIPQPGTNDISKLVPAENNNQEQLFIVRGEIISTPRLTRSQRGQFWLEATQLDEVKNDQGAAAASKGVTGKLYVTVPILQATGLHPGQQVAVTGILYKPKPPSNPGAFDFQKFLQQEGAFAGFVGRLVNILNDEQNQWGWWRIREQIVRSQVRWLGVPEGPLVSAMVIGSKAVDLPYYIRDAFVKAGLAHALAASGFQTSLILSVVLSLTKRFNRVLQVTLGSLALIIFLCLTGFQPAVLRAVVMGFAVLIGLGLKRKIKQLGLLLLAATLLLLFNPLWIWDLGFQLSFLATLGLIVTVPPLTKRLEWLPRTIASLIAVPLAATIWTLPVQLFVFGVVPIYSLILNIITTPFISVISIGGIINALTGLIVPNTENYLAGILYYPSHWLIKLVEFFSNLPGNSFAIGKIAVWQVLAVYGLIALVWIVRWWQKRWWLALLTAIGLVLIPGWYSANTLFRVTVLAAGEEPVMVIQDRGKIALVNSGDEGTGRFTIVPFLQQQGVNKIDWAIASNFQPDSNNGWLEVLQSLPIKVFYDYFSPSESTITSQIIQQEVQKQKGFYQPVSVGQTVGTNSIVVQYINNGLPILQMQIQGQTWLLVGNLKPVEIRRLVKTGQLPRPQVLWCPGESFKELVVALQPQVAITSNTNIDQKALSELSKDQTRLYITGKDGAIQWTLNGDFETFIQGTENKTSVL
ncbi:ComEC/Rec2 family competence protein [Chlorogloeopsis sp. ULAP02]|uniref:ComEC/Rec2 family competence protein n=1 Tax=Chlorogloeopsis sp. ULAP02 TaxID=3107926 RepID=UPI003136E6E9